MITIRQSQYFSVAARCCFSILQDFARSAATTGLSDQLLILTLMFDVGLYLFRPWGPWGPCFPGRSLGEESY